MSFWQPRATGIGERNVPREIDKDEVCRFLTLVADPDLSFQIQGLPSGRHQIVRGDTDLLWIKYVEEFSGDKGVYYSLNPCPSGRINPVTAQEMVCRRWLLIDIDSIRPRDVNATQAEKDAAGRIAEEIDGFLDKQGFPAPLLVDSGNGWHLLYRINLPNDEESRQLIKAVLACLASRFDTSEVHIDKVVYNANRVAKIPGTWARKGSHSEDRPQRMAKLVSVPDKVEIVSVDLLRKLIETETGEQIPDKPIEEKVPVSVSTNTPAPWELKATDKAGPDAYIKAALEKAIDNVRQAVPGNQGGEGRNNVTNKEAYSLAGLVGQGLDKDVIEAELINAATSAGLPEAEARRTIKSGLEAGLKKPRVVPEATQQENGSQAKKNSTPNTYVPAIWKLPDLLKADLPAPNWAVRDLLSEGLTILAGRPKLGKSMVALNLGLTVAAGGDALGFTHVAGGDVLYLSLEDRLRRVQDRSRKMLTALSHPASERLHIAIEWPRQDKGGLDAIVKWIEGVPRPNLVIIDVWPKFRPVALGNRNAYDVDYEHISALKSVCDSHKISVLLIHHTKKGRSDDAIEEVSGTLGQAGAADGVLVLTRVRSETTAELFVTGRDVEERSLAMEFDPDSFVWRITGLAGEQTDSKLKISVIAFMKAHCGEVKSLTEIADQLDTPREKRSYLRCLLGRMVDDGLLARAGFGKFKWTTHSDLKI